MSWCFRVGSASGAETDDTKQVPTMAQLLTGALKSTPILPLPPHKDPSTTLKQIQLNFISCLSLYNSDMSSVKQDLVLQSGPIFLEMRKQEEAKAIIENS